jgi:uncharacterized membrane protein
VKGRAILLLACVFLGITPVFAAEEPCLVIQNPLFSKLTIHATDFVSRTLVVGATREGSYVASTTLPNLHFNPSILTLKAGETGYFNTTVVGSDALPGAYVGTFNLTGGGETQSFPIVIEVESETKSYDVNLDVPPLYTNVFPGERLVFQTTLFNLYQGEYPVNAENLDVVFSLYTATGRLVATQEENIIVTDTTRLTKSFILAEDSECTEYVITAVVKANEGNSVGVATQSFRVIEKPSAISSYISANPMSLVLAIVILAVLIIAIILFIRATRN